MLGIVEEKAKVACSSCNKSLSFPLNHSGRVRCPICHHEFPVGDHKDNLEIEINKDRNFLIGLIFPMSPPIIIFLLLSTGILESGSSPDLMGLIYFMCSLLLWPIIGFGIAFSSGTFVKSFRAGARISAIASLIISGLIWILFFSFISGGVTN